MNGPTANHRVPLQWLWIIIVLAVVIIAAISLRISTNILHLDFQFDERYITQPIDDLITKGWSVATAIDFKETKGPGLIWPYAIIGEILGGELNDLRLVSVIFFCLGALPLLLIARRCGIHGPALGPVAILYLLIPYNAVLGQLVMSEAIFALGSLCLLLTFLWGLDATSEKSRRLAAPIIFAIILSALLHNRIHALAYAGATALVALERDGWRSWPWWLACVIAGLSRVPLWLRWGGLVSPEYAQMHGIGLRLDSVTYLAAALVPYTGLLIWPAIFNRASRKLWWLMAGGAVIGLGLSIVAPADLQHLIPVQFDDVDERLPQFSGVIASFVRATAPMNMQMVVMALLTMLGMASLGALAAIAWSVPGSQESPRANANVLKLQFWTFASGLGLYTLTYGYVFDRYLMAWAVLMPIVWWIALPRWLLAVQIVGLAGIAASLVRTWLY